MFENDLKFEDDYDIFQEILIFLLLIILCIWIWCRIKSCFM